MKCQRLWNCGFLWLLSIHCILQQWIYPLWHYGVLEMLTQVRKLFRGSCIKPSLPSWRRGRVGWGLCEVKTPGLKSPDFNAAMWLWERELLIATSILFLWNESPKRPKRSQGAQIMVVSLSITLLTLNIPSVHSPEELRGLHAESKSRVWTSWEFSVWLWESLRKLSQLVENLKKDWEEGERLASPLCPDHTLPREGWGQGNLAGRVTCGSGD